MKKYDGITESVVYYLVILYKDRSTLFEDLGLQIIKSIASFKDDTLVYIAVPVYEKERDFESLFLLAEELEKQNKDSSYILNILSNIIVYDNIYLTNKYMLALHTDTVGFVNYLILNQKFDNLNTYLNVTSGNLSFSELEQICCTIGKTLHVYHVTFSQNIYTIIATIVNQSIDFNDYLFDLLFIDDSQRRNFSYHCVSQSGYTGLIVNSILVRKYCNYLFKVFNSEFIFLENKIIDSWSPATLNSFVLLIDNISPSSKRKILEKIISFKQSGETAKFIINNPEYKKLLPMI